MVTGLSGGVEAADVWVQFGTNFQTELNVATAAAGVTDFTDTERDQIQTTILDELANVYAGYDITFSTTDPGGVREILNWNDPVVG